MGHRNGAHKGNSEVCTKHTENQELMMTLARDQFHILMGSEENWIEEGPERRQ